MNILQVSLMTFAIAVAAGPAAARPPIIVTSEAPTVRVSYADINIGSPAGLATLNNRVSRAAHVMCTEAGHTTLEQQMAEDRCLTTAMDSARVAIEQAAATYSNRVASLSTIELSSR